MAHLLEKAASRNQPRAGRGMPRKRKKGTKRSLDTRQEENLLLSQRLERVEKSQTAPRDSEQLIKIPKA